MLVCALFAHAGPPGPTVFLILGQYAKEKALSTPDISFSTDKSSGSKNIVKDKEAIFRSFKDICLSTKKIDLRSARGPPGNLPVSRLATTPLIPSLSKL